MNILKEDIRNLRTKYFLSLDDFSKILGCAKKTLISYEQGISVPNDNYLILFKTLIKSPELITCLIDSNKERFTDKELNRILKKLNMSLNNNYIMLDNINKNTLYMFK